jgi:hypothetical protein
MRTVTWSRRPLLKLKLNEKLVRDTGRTTRVSPRTTVSMPSSCLRSPDSVSDGLAPAASMTTW